MRRALLVVLAIGGAGCGDNISFQAYLDEQRDATCGYYVRCGTVATVGDCRAYLARTETNNANLDAAIDAGKVHWDTAAGDACIAAFDALDCDYADQPKDALAPCEAVFTGTLALGESCAFDLECESGDCSLDPSCIEACCLGVCDEPRRYPGVGEPCTTICDGDLFCNFNQVCEEPLGEGAPCNSFTVCAEPLVCNSYCVPRPQRGEYCLGSCATEGDVCGPSQTCEPARVAGDDCATLYECSYFYYCNFDTRSCEPMPSQSGLSNGERCNVGAECRSHYCDDVCTDPPICI